MKKRILPALLALCMVVSLLPVAVFAATQTVTDKTVTATYKCDCDDASHSGNAGSVCGTSVEKEIQVSYTYDDAQSGDQAAKEAAAIKVETDKGGVKCDACKAGHSAGGDDPGEEETPATCPTCGCAYGEGSACTPAELNEDGSVKKAAVCGCLAATDACEDEHCTVCKNCTNELCTAYGTKVGGGHVHEQLTACAEGKNNGALTSCTKAKDDKSGTGHVDGCPFKCDFGTCTKDAGHDGAHSDTTTCSNDEHCGVAAAATADIAKHNPDCPVLKAALEAEDSTLVDEGKAVGVYETTKKVEQVCTCSEAKHPDHNGADTAACTEKLTATLTVKVNIVYTEPDFTDMTDAEKAEAIEDAIKTEAEGDSAAAVTAAVNAAETAWKAENAGWICDSCKAQLTGACNMHADCEAAEHLKDCLSQCTLGANCPNSVGVSTAHRVQYTVVENGAVVGTYNVRADAVAQFNQLYQAKATELETARKAFAAAQAGDDAAATAAAKTAYDNAVKAWNAYTLIVEAIHCPKAGVPNGTVIEVDDGAVVETPDDNTTDTPKAPEKAADFDDLKGDEWYAEELTAALEKGFFKGSLDAGKYSFKATDKMNTSTLVVLVSRVLDKGFKTEGADWDKEAVEWAAKDGLTEGVEAGEVTRKDVVLVLWRAAGKPASEQDVSAFTDLADLEGDELTAMKWAVEKEIIKGDAGETKTARPADSITRAEMVAVVNRFDGVVNKK